MTLPLMPKATAVWLIENTTLTFDQIGKFCGMHALEVRSIADGDAGQVIGQDPVALGQISKEELLRAQEDSSYEMNLSDGFKSFLKMEKKKSGRYTPVAQRQDKPDAIAWLIKNHPEFSDSQIVKLIGTTKNTIKAIREKTHWNMQNLRPRDPVLLGLCTQTDLQTMVARASGSKKAS